MRCKRRFQNMRHKKKISEYEPCKKDLKYTAMKKYQIIYYCNYYNIFVTLQKK